MRDDLERFTASGTAVYGVNPAGPDSHRNYVQSKGFNFPLLSDADRTVANRFGALKENGKSIARTVYVVDREGKIAYARRGMPSDDDILAAVE